MNIEYSEKPMTWADAIEFALSKGKVLPNAKTMKYMIDSGLIPIGFEAWSSTTNDHNIFNARTTSSLNTDGVGSQKIEMYNFYMIDPCDQLQSYQTVSFINGDL